MRLQQSQHHKEKCCGLMEERDELGQSPDSKNSRDQEELEP